MNASDNLNNLQEQLKDLRDIHMPEPVSIWPLAPGWWILLILIPVLFFIVRFIVRRLLMPKYKKIALQELSNITTNYAVAKNSHETCGEISLLIRKALVAKLGNQEVAGLVTGEWLAYLDNLSKTDSFSNGAGRHIVTTPYAKHDGSGGIIPGQNISSKGNLPTESDIEELIVATKKLLGRL